MIQNTHPPHLVKCTAMPRTADETAPMVADFLRLYACHAPEAVRLFHEQGQKVALCVEHVPTAIRPGLVLVGKTVIDLLSELDPTAHTVRFLAQTIKTYDPEREALFVLQFDRDHVEFALSRLGYADELGDSEDPA